MIRYLHITEYNDFYLMTREPTPQELNYDEDFFLRITDTKIEIYDPRNQEWCIMEAKDATQER